MRYIIGFVLCFGLISFVGTSFAHDGYCSKNQVRKGFTKDKVYKICGNPVTTYIDVDGGVVTGGVVSGGIVVGGTVVGQKTFEVWEYKALGGKSLRVFFHEGHVSKTDKRRKKH